MRYKLFVDGAARGNPGPAGAGVYLIRDDSGLIKEGCFLGVQTNNSAEYLALALGLFLMSEMEEHFNQSTSIKIYSDSQLLVRQMQGAYMVRQPHIVVLKSLVDELMKKNNFHPASIPTFEHIPREKNDVADSLANRGINSKNPLPREFAKLLGVYGIWVPQQDV